jgi:hypothetical protein
MKNNTKRIIEQSKQLNETAQGKKMRKTFDSFHEVVDALISSTNAINASISAMEKTGGFDSKHISALKTKAKGVDSAIEKLAIERGKMFEQTDTLWDNASNK